VKPGVEKRPGKTESVEKRSGAPRGRKKDGTEPGGGGGEAWKDTQTETKWCKKRTQTAAGREKLDKGCRKKDEIKESIVKDIAMAKTEKERAETQRQSRYGYVPTRERPPRNAPNQARGGTGKKRKKIQV